MRHLLAALWLLAIAALAVAGTHEVGTNPPTGHWVGDSVGGGGGGGGGGGPSGNCTLDTDCPLDSAALL